MTEFKWVFEIPLEDVRDEDYKEKGGGANICFCCGKVIKNPTYFVHLLSNGNLVSSDQAFDEKEDMGFYPIGNECKKRLPNNFYFKE